MASFLSTRLAPALITAALLGMTVPGARAQTDVSGMMNTGTPGDHVSGAGTLDTSGFFAGDYLLSGTGVNSPDLNPGGDGYGFNNGTYNVHDNTLTGGTGGESTGAYDAMSGSSDGLPDVVFGGAGGFGLNVGQGSGNPTTATIQSGTYTGGVGGTADGQANINLSGGYGGDGALIFDATATINGGTFQGGASGPASGTAPALSSGIAGSGLNVNFFSPNVTINGGTFTGGNGADVPFSSGDPSVNGGNGSSGGAGSGLIVIAGSDTTVDVYGGTFTAGHNGASTDSNGNVTPGAPGSDLALYGNAATTLFGSDFTYTITENGMTTAGTGPVTFTVGPNGEQPTGTITGFLQNNSQTVPTTLTFFIQGGTLTLAAAPEPSAWAGLGVGMLGLAGLGWKARRRVA